jgi:hypothetical protein
MTFLSGIGTALVLFTVPLSFTFEGVSIPFIQLIMRGDVLIIAPIVDLLFGRKVRWWSWVALAMVMAALVITDLRHRGGLYLPPIAILTVVLYTLGYFIRLAVMNRISKDGDPASVRRYFVEEKMIALPLSVAALAAVSASGIGGQAGQLAFGFAGRVERSGDLAAVPDRPDPRDDRGGGDRDPARSPTRTPIAWRWSALPVWSPDWWAPTCCTGAGICPRPVRARWPAPSSWSRPLPCCGSHRAAPRRRAEACSGAFARDDPESDVDQPL